MTDNKADVSNTSSLLTSTDKIAMQHLLYKCNLIIYHCREKHPAESVLKEKGIRTNVEVYTEALSSRRGNVGYY